MNMQNTFQHQWPSTPEANEYIAYKIGRKQTTNISRLFDVGGIGEA